MVWKKQFDVHGTFDVINSADMKELTSRLRKELGVNSVEATKEFHHEKQNFTFSIIFHNENARTAPMLEEKHLTELMTDLLHEDVQIRIQPGGSGSAA